MFQFIYNSSPIFIQNIIISLYGLKLKYLRFYGGYNKTLKSLLLSQYYTEKQILDLQNSKLKKLIKDSYEFIPHYTSLLDEKKIKPEDIDIHNFTKYFPILQKDEVRSHPASFTSSKKTLGKTIKINTSGTSGSPLNVLTSKNAIQENYAFFARYLLNCGVKIGQPSVTFAGRIIVPKAQKKPPFWRKNYSMNNTLFSSYNISEDTIPSYIKELDRIQPRFIDTYPSALFEIAHFIVKNNIKHSIKPIAIITSSETLLDSQRKIIEQAFDTKIYDHYGSAEMSAFITQCREGNYHINPDFGIVEILDSQGNEVKEGEVGNIVCTGFVNRKMPFIRYSIGDSAKYSTKSCACGSHFHLIDSIEGRTDDLLILRDGRKIGRLDPVFKGLKSIKETQIVQVSLDKISVSIVKESDYDDEQNKILIRELKKRVGNDIDVTINFVNEIQRTKSGKFRAVISEL